VRADHGQEFVQLFKGVIKIRIEADAAKEKIEKAGGQAVVLPGKAPVVKGKKKQPAEKTK